MLLPQFSKGQDHVSRGHCGITPLRGRQGARMPGFPLEIGPKLRWAYNRTHNAHRCFGLHEIEPLVDMQFDEATQPTRWAPSRRQTLHIAASLCHGVP